MTDAPYRLAGRRVWVAGHGGMVGAALVRRLAHEDCEILTVGRAEVDLRRQSDVEAWLADVKPQAVVMAAATVGGIQANDSRPAEFIYDNLAIETNVVHGAWRCGVEKLLFLGSSCIYPRDAAQPMAEDALLTGPLEATNQWYAVAKIAGLKLCQAYRRHLYGPGDNFDPASSHVIAALLHKAHEAKTAGAEALAVWGSGRPRREFLYVEDLADALAFLLQNYSGEAHVNVGAGKDIAIGELAALIAEVTGFAGDLVFDPSKPDGTPRKLLDVSRLRALGWAPSTGLRDGLAQTYRWYCENALA
jgi:GDP-L-fucose synthase